MQVLDYGCTVKMDQGRRVVLGQAKLLKLFMLLRGRDTTEYEKALLASLLVWARNKHGKSFLWKMFKQNACAFNEEAGEVAFSVLARQVSKGGLRGDLESCDKAFKLSKVNIQVADDFNVDLCGDHMGDSKRFTVEAHGDSVNATVAFFENAIRQILVSRYREYSSDYGKDRRSDGARVTVPMTDVETKYQEDSQALLATAEGKLTAYINGATLSRYLDAWGMNADQQVDVFMGSDRSSEEQPQDLSPVEVVSALDFEIKSQQDEKKALSSADDTPPPRPLADRLGVPGNSPMLNRIATSPRPRKRKRYKGIMFQGARRSKETLIGTILAVKAFKFGNRQWQTKVFAVPSKSILHMKIVKIVPGNSWAYCEMLHYPQMEYAHKLNTKEVNAYVCDVGCEHIDTEFLNGYQFDADESE
jgi:hypothetical protein